MGLTSVWKNYKVLIVMGTGIGLMHWGWYRMQSNPIFNPSGEIRVPSFIPVHSGKDTDAKGK
uniref:Uncharacterized protein n=1 Tax=Pyxicephalus adspersus TaxID=30357 RepID=A0AAV3ACN4_PYXAD|nr:TPA: hypothetical protein GDO54_011279 [Pyxicephalus adspersus]